MHDEARAAGRWARRRPSRSSMLSCCPHALPPAANAPGRTAAAAGPAPTQPIRSTRSPQNKQPSTINHQLRTRHQPPTQPPTQPPNQPHLQHEVQVVGVAVPQQLGHHSRRQAGACALNPLPHPRVVVVVLASGGKCARGAQSTGCQPAAMSHANAIACRGQGQLRITACNAATRCAARGARVWREAGGRER